MINGGGERSTNVYSAATVDHHQHHHHVLCFNNQLNITQLSTIWQDNNNVMLN